MAEIPDPVLWGLLFSVLGGIWIRIEKTWAKLCKLARVAKKTHPKECKDEGL